MDKSTVPEGVEHVRYNVLAETLSDEEFNRLFPALKERKYEADAVICEEDSPGDDLYLVAKGRVNITRRTKDGCDLRLAVLHPGDFFGELGLLDGRPRSARVIAAEACTVYALDRASFERIVQESHPFYRAASPGHQCPPSRNEQSRCQGTFPVPPAQPARSRKDEPPCGGGAASEFHP